LEKTAEWYQQYTQTPDAMQEVSLDQIADYQQRMFELGQKNKATPTAAVTK
jgi:hypothetical protein